MENKYQGMNKCWTHLKQDDILIPYSEKLWWETWQIWQNECHSPIFYPAKF